MLHDDFVPLGMIFGSGGFIIFNIYFSVLLLVYQQENSTLDLYHTFWPRWHYLRLWADVNLIKLKQDIL